MVRRMVFTGASHIRELLISSQTNGAAPFSLHTGYWYEYVAA